VESEKFFTICITKAATQDRVSEKFKNCSKQFILFSLPPSKDKLFISQRYKFVIEYNDGAHLKRMYGGYKEHDRIYILREPTEEERNTFNDVNV
jgi:hypothetical protein